MNILNPIFTQKTECQDCYKCVRICPYKAIKIEDAHAIVIPEACVSCGKCVEICPAKAKKVRNDLVRAKYLINTGKKVIASIAPSFRACIPPEKHAGFINAFSRCGFYGVSETALGAQAVSAALKDVIREGEVNITSCCPVVVEVIAKYYPHLSSKLTPVLSPALAHAKILKEQFGADAEVVFVGPCIAKKLEADRYPSLMSLSLSFADMEEWGGDFAVEETAQPFITEECAQGNYYPLEGGMLRTIDNAQYADKSYLAFSGMRDVRMALDGIAELETGETVVLELMACRGGCINGPLANKEISPLAKRKQIIKSAENRKQETVCAGEKIAASWEGKAFAATQYSEDEINTVLRSIGKTREDEMLNCGGCGYDSCREFARAVLEKKGERSMCVTYMRRLAQKKANALIKSMPSGVVIVNDKLEIIECNYNFASLFIEQAQTIFNARPGLEGGMIERILPPHICSVFRSVLESGNDFCEKDVRAGKNFYHCSIFSIEHGHVAGGIFQDVTSPMMRKKNVIDKAQRVITRNLETVQTIAALLGENAANTEVLLNSIIESFSATELGEGSDE